MTTTDTGLIQNKTHLNIGVFAPSSLVNVEKIQSGKALLEGAGHKVTIHPQTYLTEGQFAGSDQDKTQAFQDLWCDTDIDIILCARGGNGIIRWLYQIDPNIFTNISKPVIGCSDVTILLNHLVNSHKVVTYHGPTLQQLVDCDETADYFLEFMQNPSNALRHVGNKGYVLQNGHAHGQIIGGNIATFSSLLLAGEPIDYSDKILLLEECGEEDSRLDRMLTSLFANPNLHKMKGIMIGKTVAAEDTSISAPFHLSFEESLKYNLKKHDLTDIPVIWDAPIGHEKPNYIVPLGQEIILNADNEKYQIALATTQGTHYI